MAFVDLTTLEKEMKAMHKQMVRLEKLLFLLLLRHIPENEKTEAITEINKLLNS